MSKFKKYSNIILIITGIVFIIIGIICYLKYYDVLNMPTSYTVNAPAENDSESNKTGWNLSAPITVYVTPPSPPTHLAIIGFILINSGICFILIGCVSILIKFFNNKKLKE